MGELLKGVTEYANGLNFILIYTHILKYVLIKIPFYTFTFFQILKLKPIYLKLGKNDNKF